MFPSNSDKNFEKTMNQLELVWPSILLIWDEMNQKELEQSSQDVHQQALPLLSEGPSSSTIQMQSSTPKVKTLRRKCKTVQIPSERARAYRERKNALKNAATNTQHKIVTTQPHVADKVVHKEEINFLSLKGLSLAKCLEVISLVDEHEIIAIKTNLSVQKVKTICKYKEYIQKISKYLPDALNIMAPKKINKIVAITEILKEFMRRLSHQNFKLTNEELMQNAKILTNLFSVNYMPIDEKWTQFFRNNFKQSNPIEKPIEKAFENEFDVRYILKHVQHMLDPEVVGLFYKHLQFQTDDLILICTEMSEKQIEAKKQTCFDKSESDKETLLKDMLSKAQDRIDDFKEIQDAITDTIEKEPRELNIKEEVKVWEYTINVNANEMLHGPQDIRIKEEDEVEEFMTNDNSNEFIKIYAVIDEDNEENLMDVDKYTAKTLSRSDVIGSRTDSKYFKRPGNITSNYTAKDTENYKYLQKITFDQIKKEPIKMNSNKHIKEEEKQFEEPQAMLNFYVESVAPKIKQEPNEINTAADNTNYYRDREEFEELESQVMQSPKQNSQRNMMDLEIKQEPSKKNTDFDKNENDIYREMFQDTQTIKCLLRQKYIVSIEHKI